jgi:hypothetical protein
MPAVKPIMWLEGQPVEPLVQGTMLLPLVMS